MRLAACAAAVLVLAAQPAAAAPADVLARTPMSEASLTAVRQALDERRFSDASRLIDILAVGGAKDLRLALLAGELQLAQGRPATALESYRRAASRPGLHARAIEGEGIALALLERPKEAEPVLRQAVAEDPAAWRAWNALGAVYDAAGRWSEAEAAYARALESSAGAALVLNNRGYSRLLQRRCDEAVADLTAALERRPDFAEARANLRLALAMSGDYQRALNGALGPERATWLNNAGFIAAVRGDFGTAERFLKQAQDAKGEHYARAAENLRVAQALENAGGAK